jgi:hypothetical protein
LIWTFFQGAIIKNSLNFNSVSPMDVDPEKPFEKALVPTNKGGKTSISSLSPSCQLHHVGNAAVNVGGVVDGNSPSVPLRLASICNANPVAPGVAGEDEFNGTATADV